MSLRMMGLSLLFAASAVLPALADDAATIVVDANETSGEAMIGIGGHLVVKLIVSGGTGYSWALTSEAGPELNLTDQRTEKSAPRLGAPQAAVFEFDAQAAGQKALTFDLMPPGGGDPARSYALTVTVSE